MTSVLGRRAAVALAVCLGVAVGSAAGALVALSYFSTTLGAQANSVTAGVVGAGRQPTVSVSGRNVTVAWAAAANATTYTTTRANAQGLSNTQHGSCAAAVSALTCTDVGLPQSGTAATSWTYTVTPHLNNWSGATGPASATVTIPGPSLTLGSSSFTANGGTTSATVASFFDNEAVTYCLDQSVSCSPANTLGTATVPATGGSVTTPSLVVPPGLAVGTHVVYAIGSLGSAPSATITVVAGAATRLAFTTQPVAGVPAGTTFATSPVVKVQDAYGNTVVADGGPVTLAISSGPASGALACSNAGFPTVNAVAGVATFSNCQITGTAAAGTYTLVATRTGLTSTGPSASVVITTGSANKLVFTTQPVAGVAEGVAFPTSPVVKIQDTSGNVITSDNGTVTLQIATGPASGILTCTNPGFPTVNAVNGVATFTGCQITGTAAAGTYTLIATRTGLTQTPASSTIVITVGAAAKLAFTTQPVGNVPEGTAFATSPVVKVQDAYGNTVTTDTGPVTLALASGPAAGILSCANAGFPAVAAVAGVAALTGCQITGTAAAGTYTLVATRTGLTATGPSSNVVVTVGAAARLAFTTQPVGNVPEGTAFTASPVVKVLDAYGNVVASDGGTVTLAIASGPAAGVLSCANAGFPAVTAVAGVATFFGCQITGTAAAGTYTLVATRTGLTSTGPSSSVVVTAGAATALTFATQPVGNVAEGVAFTTSPVVRVVDAYGNTVTTDTGPITLAISSGPASGVLGCANAGFPTVTTVAGVAAFTGCQITGTAAAGTYTLVATRTGLTAAGPSASVVITVGAAAKLAFTTQPVGNVAVGSTLTTSPVVKAQDAYGNVVTTDTGSVTLAIASGPAGGTLSCTNPGFPTVAAVAGAAAFTSCQIGGAAGTYTLVATRTGLVSSGPSADVVVTAAQTIRIAALTGTAVNQNVNFWKATVTVTVVDQGGAPAAGVVVTGAWSPVTTSPSGCTTAANGQCTIVTPNTAFPASVPTVTWAVSALAKTGSTYTPAANSQNSISLSRP